MPANVLPKVLSNVHAGGSKVWHFFLVANVAWLSAGNDALMLEKSDIGVAIAAQDADSERSSALLSCDISIPSFAMLPRLVHVHGSVIALRFQVLILLDLQVWPLLL